MVYASKDNLMRTLATAWRLLMGLHANQAGAAGDQPATDDKGSEAAASGGDAPRGLTEAALYGEDGGDGEDGGGGGDPDKSGKAGAAGKKAAKTGEGGEAEGEGGEAGKQAWDAERQQRDQEHANERHRMEELVHQQGEQITQLLGQLQAAADPKKGSGADDDLRELEEAIDGVTEDADPAAIVRSQRAILAAIKKVRSSSGPRPELTALKAQLEELKAGSAQSAADTAYARRKERQDTFLAGMDKDPAYGPDLRAPAIQLAIKAVAELGYTNENPAPLEVAILALKGGYRDARDAREAAKRKKGGKGVTLDSAGGGGPVKTGRKTGSLKQVLERMVHEGKLTR